MKRSVLVLAGCCLASLFAPVVTQAQSEFERAHGRFLMGVMRMPSTFELDASYQPKVGVEDSDVEADLVKVKTSLQKFFAVTEDLAIVTGLSFGLRNYTFDGVGRLGADLDESLYAITPQLSAVWFVTDRIMILPTFRPGIYSDLDGSLETDDFQWQGNVIGSYELNERWFLKLGVAVGEDFDETSVIPVAGFAYVPHDRLRVSILLPREASITWKPWEKRGLLIEPGIYLEGQQYHVDTAAGDADIQIQDIRADLTAKYPVAEAARVSLSVGSNFRGKYEVEGEGGFDVDADQDPSLYIAIGFDASF